MHATAPSLLQRELPNFSFLVIMELLFCSIDNSLDTIRNERKLKLCLFFSSASLSALGFKYWELHTTDNTTEVFLLSKKPLLSQMWSLFDKLSTEQEIKQTTVNFQLNSTAFLD